MPAQEPPSRQEQFAPLLGVAVIHLWDALSQDIQRQLFEHAVVIGHREEKDENLREQLAQFLHDRHKRSQQGEECARG